MNTKHIKDYPDILSVYDVMQILRVGRVTVYSYIKDNKLPARKIAGKYRIPKKSIISLVNEMSNEVCYNDDCNSTDALSIKKECEP